MGDNIAVIHKNPVGILGPLDALRLYPLPAQYLFYMIGDCFDLRSALT